MSDDPIQLVILMRNDLPYLNPGKAVAQGTHAANACIWKAPQYRDDDLDAKVREWENQSGEGFGTCIVLTGAYDQIDDIVDEAFDLSPDILSDWITDTSYPIPRRINRILTVAVAIMAVGSVYALIASSATPVMMWFGVLYVLIGLVVVICNDVFNLQRHYEPYTISTKTCAFLFGRRSELRVLTDGLRLMP